MEVGDASLLGSDLLRLRPSRAHTHTHTLRDTHQTDEAANKMTTTRYIQFEMGSKNMRQSENEMRSLCCAVCILLCRVRRAGT